MSPTTLRLSALLTLVCAAGATASAQESARPARRARNAAPVEAEASAPTPPPAYELKKRSSFTPLSEDSRAPFWPIGWVKRKAGVIAEAPVVQAPKIELDEKSFHVTSILVGNPSMAIINGRTYMEGEFLKAPRATGGAAVVSTAALPAGVRVRVYRINDGSVVLQNQRQLLTVGLQRPELTQKTAREELLQEDRP